MKNIKYTGQLSSINTEEKAYLLGQIYGDGNNSKHKRKAHSGYSYNTVIASTNTDEPLYNRLSILFPFFKIEKWKSHPNVIYLHCCQKRLYKDLMQLGMISNKVAHDKTGEFHFPELTEDMIPHFIRGYFDADGSCWYPTRKRSRNNTHIEFGCSTKNFILKLKSILDKNNINFTYKEKYKGAGNGKKYITYTIYCCNRKDALAFADYIYQNATIYLERKYQSCYKKQELSPTANEVYGNCPYCNSTNIQRKGTRNGKQRLRCYNCKKGFSKPLPK